MITFGKLIKDKRILLRLTQEQVAEKAGRVCTNVYVGRIEISGNPGRRPIRPALHIVDALATALNIPLKTAREAANYAAPAIGTTGESSIRSELTELFVGYERLESPFREQAVSLCVAVFDKFYETQMGYIQNDGINRHNGLSVSANNNEVARDGDATRVTRQVPVIYAETEQDYRAEEEQREREAQFMIGIGRKTQEKEDGEE